MMSPEPLAGGIGALGFHSQSSRVTFYDVNTGRARLFAPLNDVDAGQLFAALNIGRAVCHGGLWRLNEDGRWIEGGRSSRPGPQLVIRAHQAAALALRLAADPEIQADRWLARHAARFALRLGDWSRLRAMLRSAEVYLIEAA